MKRYKISLAAFLFISAIGFAKPKIPAVVEKAIAIAETDRTQAAQSLEDALASDLSLTEDQRSLVIAHAGEQHRLNNHSNDALRLFSSLSDGKPWAPAARLGTILIDAERDLKPELSIALLAFEDKSVLPTQNADRYFYLTILATQQGDVEGVKEYSKKSLGFAKSDALLLEKIRTRLSDIAAGRTEPMDRNPLAAAEAAWAAGDFDKARKLAESLAQGSDEASQVARYLLEKIDRGTRVNSKKIGVLLPLTGKYESVGKQIRQALEFGFQSAKSSRELVFVDAGETTASAVTALERLVLDQGVIAVVGPLRSEGALETAQAAEALRIPLLGLSQANDIAEQRNWVFEGGITLEDQVEALLSVTMGQQGLKKFAIFAPDSVYGRASAATFRAEVEERGGQITAEQLYDADATDLVPFAKKLGRKDYSGRQAELSRLRSEAKAAGGDPSKVVLPPTIDFEALFLPDNVNRVPIACAGLAYEEFPIGDFRPKRGSPTIPLLGLSGWNNDTLVSRGGQYVRGALFTDAWHPSMSGAEAFIHSYQERFDREPTPMEAVVVDLGALLAQAALTPASDPLAFRDALASAALNHTVSGTNGFESSSRRARHTIQVFTLTSREIIPWTPTATTP